jgi:hypothetical protein
MAPSLTTYCLENLTDYSDFERLCHDLMLLEGYSKIEPLGGFSDKGRAAIHVSHTGKVTIFAYSVREDWQAKLPEDAAKIKKNGHACNELVFITTKQPTATQRDKWIAEINQSYGWQLEIFGIERLRLLLDTKYPEVKKNHPAIFFPGSLPIQESSNQSLEREHILISYVAHNFVLADWLARKLKTEGYRVWFKHFDESITEDFPDDVDNAIKEKIFCMIALYSKESLKDLDITRQRNIAVGISEKCSKGFVIPLRVDDFLDKKLDEKTKALSFILFQDNWAEGFKNLLTRLKNNNCPKPIFSGRNTSAESFLYKDVLLDKAETLHSNYFIIEAIPKLVYQFESKTDFFKKELLNEISLKWPFRQERSSNRFISFFYPDQKLKEDLKIVSSRSQSWEENIKVYGINSKNLISELIKQSLIVKFSQKGLKYCQESKLWFFPEDLLEKNNLGYKKLDGSKAKPIKVCGRRKYKGKFDEYCYYLSPSFSVAQELIHGFSVILTVRVRLSDTTGNPLKKNKMISRRKDLCKNWWNLEWSNRILAVSQFFADEDKIIVGSEEHQQVIIQATPICFESTVSVDEKAKARYKLAQEELLVLGDFDDEFNDDD